MMSGIPLNLADKSVDDTIKEQYPGAKSVRLTKNGHRIEFANTENLKHAIANRIRFKGCDNLVFRSDFLYSTKHHENFNGY